MHTALKVLLIIVLIFVGTAAMLTVAGVFIARNIHVRESGAGSKKTVNIDTPLGHLQVHENAQLDPEQVGIPIYPGATRNGDKGGADFQFDAGDLHKDFTVAAATYSTSDPPEKVREFYQRKFPSWHSKWEHGDFHIETEEDGHLRSIAIKRENDRTRIGVASVGPPAGN